MFFHNSSYLLTQTIDKTSQQFSSFNVGTMLKYPETGLLFVGVCNLGILVYDIDHRYSLTLYEVQNIYDSIESVYTPYKIIDEPPYGLHIIIEEVGMFSMYYEQDIGTILFDDFESTSVRFSHMYYNMMSERMTHRAVGNSHGYVHLIYNETADKGFITYLRLFSYFSHNNSKQLQAAFIDKNVDCQTPVS